MRRSDHPQSGDRLFVEPICNGGLLSLLASLSPLNETFPDIDEDLPPEEDVLL